MTITATHSTASPESWVQDEDGYTLDPGKSFLAWHETDGPQDGFTVGIDEDVADAAYNARTLAAAANRFPGHSIVREYSDMGARHFVFGPATAKGTKHLRTV